MKKLSFAIILAMLLQVSLCFAQTAQSAPATVATAPALTDSQWIEQVYYPATALVYMQNAKGSMVFICTATAFEKKSGSGFFSGGDTYRFVSAAHCVSESTDSKVEMRKQAVYYMTSDDSNEKKFLKARVIYAGNQMEGNDFSVFEVQTKEKFPLVALGKDAESVVGEDIVNISAPLGFGKQVFYGRVSSPKVDRPLQFEDSTWTGFALLQIYGPGPGSSGSSIVCIKQRAICSFLIGTLGGGSIVANPVSRLEKVMVDIDAGKIKPPTSTTVIAQNP